MAKAKDGTSLGVAAPPGSAFTPFQTASVTIETMPTQEGAPLTVRVHLDYASGDVLDRTFTGFVTSQRGPCDGATAN
jgi:hypothetical protein